MPLAPPPHQHPPLASRPAPRPASHDLFSTRQSASTFNQPLGFDTSSVRSMSGMFSVRSARALWPPAFSWTLPVHAVCTTTAPTPPSHLPARTSPRFVCPPCASQQASSFNQLLSFDTSKVTSMHTMFTVRSRACPGSQLSIPVHAACSRRHPPPLPPPGPHFGPHLMPSLRLGMPGRAGVQSAAELRHVQRHRHELHVLRALRACPGPHSLELGPPRACRLGRGRPMRCRLPAARTSSRIVCPPSTRQLAYAFNQPLRFDTSKVTTMSDMFYVRSARALAPSLGSGPPRARRFRCRHTAPTALSPPGPHLALHRMPSLRLSRTRPCPTQTSCSSVARGRATRTIPVIMARTGLRVAAPEDRLHVCARD